MADDASQNPHRFPKEENWGGSIANQKPPERQAGNIITYHTNMGKLPTRDIPARKKPKPTKDYPQGRDSRGRVMGEDGSTVGVHYGTIAAGWDRVQHEKDPAPALSHPVKFHSSQQFGRGDHPDLAKSNASVMPWSDETVNYNESLTDMVEEGRVIPYRNDVEDTGSISYRADPKVMRRWSDDVLAAPKSGHGAPHPAYTYLAEKGYNPVVETGKIQEQVQYGPRQLPLTAPEYKVPRNTILGEPLPTPATSPMPPPLKGQGHEDEFTKMNIHHYNKESARLSYESHGRGPQFNQWTMKKGI